MLSLALILVSIQVHALEESCLYRNIYDSNKKNYVLFNAIEILSTKSIPSEHTLSTQWSLASNLANTRCSESVALLLQEVREIAAGDFQLRINDENYRLQISENVSLRKLVFMKTEGKFAQEPLLTIVRNGERPSFIHIVGRDGPTQEITRYDFIFAGSDSQLVHQSPRDYSRTKTIRSLKSIYGRWSQSKKPKISIGVIGTGLDYNHPGLANLLAFREQMEEGLIVRERLEEKLRFHAYSDVEEFVRDQSSFQNQMLNLGFPRWMDQALGTPEPMDQVIVNGRVAPGQTHETRITSRIVSRGDPVTIFFVRRMMGTEHNHFQVESVVENMHRHGVRLVNMSFGSSCGILPREEIQWQNVFRKYSDMVFVVSAGNSGVDVDKTPLCPAVFSRDFKNVISVTALSENGELATYFDSQVNYGLSVDLAVRADNLPVLAPTLPNRSWVLNPRGGTSVAAAEISRMIFEAMVDGYLIDPLKVKDLLIQSSRFSKSLTGLVGNSAEVDESAFRAKLKKLN